MPDLILDLPPTTAGSAPPGSSALDLMHGALLESRRRWRHLVSLAADLAFETDAAGRIVFALPDSPLGWPPGSLTGQPADLLLAEEAANDGFNPFHVTAEVRHRRCWLRRHDGTLAMMAVSASPIRDAAGTILGTRVTAIDVTDLDRPPTAIGSRLRHGDVLDQVLTRVGQETEADRMMDVALWSMMHALDAEGAAVLAALSEDTGIELIHECGPGGLAITDYAARLLAADVADPRSGINPDGRIVLAIACPSRFSTQAGLAVWRPPGGAAWGPEEAKLAASATGVVRMILDYEAMLQRMAEQARTDPLTGLLNRRAFMEEMGRHLIRLDREPAPGTLMFLDVDSFKSVNDRHGHAAGDAVLTTLADILRKLVRPSDLIARLGGDEFAVWLSGADHMTAAERADYLCKTTPSAFRAAMPVADPEAHPGAGLSIGIATRAAGSQETTQDLVKRADLAMYEVKRGGRGHWRVALMDAPA
jgi:diguanylate cyclase (GGDEF)-like protein/PAS domain S-box-containing protein